MKRLAPGADMVSFYGATETPQAMGWQRAGDECDRDRALIPIGVGISDVQLLVRTPHGIPAGVGEFGEIWVRTAHLAQRYVGEPVLTAERFQPAAHGSRAYRTGDLGRYLPDGRVMFEGRSDGQVKIRGFRVDPVEVSRALERHPDIRQALVAEAGSGTLASWTCRCRSVHGCRPPKRPSRIFGGYCPTMRFPVHLSALSKSR